MIKTIFQKSLCVSLLGHVTLFTIFSFSFGYKIPPLDYSGISFWGSTLKSYDLSNREITPTTLKKLTFSKNSATALLKGAKENLPLIPFAFVKPQVGPILTQDKKVAPIEEAIAPPLLKKKEAVITFHPALPYDFLLYFKDRQVAHIELAFNRFLDEQTDSVVIKRKISSGNLETDLLTLRYLSHYFFIQKFRISPNTWQTVKIELSPKND